MPSVTARSQSALRSGAGRNDRNRWPIPLEETVYEGEKELSLYSELPFVRVLSVSVLGDRSPCLAVLTSTSRRSDSTTSRIA